MKLKVLSWNIYKGKFLKDVIQFLTDVNADVLGLQEIIEEGIGVKRTNTASVIAGELGYHYVYYKAFTHDRTARIFDQGNAILSKYPIKESYCHFLSSPDLYRRTAETEPRIAVEAIVSVNNTALTLFTTHLAYSHKFQSSAVRTVQFDSLLALLPQTRTVLLGDFNCSHKTKEMKKLRGSLINADSNPVQPTWPVSQVNYHGFTAKRLAYRIDHIFVSKDMWVNDFQVPHVKGSDHLPVVAILDI